jgi:cytochrome c-type biogenesis protein
VLGDLIVAFSAGAVSFFAPCVVPLLPAYVTLLGGARPDGAAPAAAAGAGDAAALRARIASGGLLFVAGFAVVFIAFGVAAGFVGGTALSSQKVLAQRIGGVLVIVLGLALLGWLPGRFAERGFQLVSPHRRPTPVLLGLAFGTAWTPCVGPVLAAILGLAATRGGALQGGVLLAAYALGLGLPFVLCSLLVASFPAVVRPLARYSVWISRAAGGLMVLLGVLLVAGVYQSLAGYLAQPFTLR